MLQTYHPSACWSRSRLKGPNGSRTKLLTEPLNYSWVSLKFDTWKYFGSSSQTRTDWIWLFSLVVVFFWFIINCALSKSVYLFLFKDLNKSHKGLVTKVLSHCHIKSPFTSLLSSWKLSELKTAHVCSPFRARLWSLKVRLTGQVWPADQWISKPQTSVPLRLLTAAASSCSERMAKV